METIIINNIVDPSSMQCVRVINEVNEVNCVVYEKYIRSSLGRLPVRYLGIGLESRPGARFSKLPVMTGPVKLFCFPFQMGVLKGLKTVQ